MAVAIALVGDPELLFLDEPTTGLDPQSRRQLWEVIRGLHDRGRTTVLTTHYMDEAERLCDRVAIIDHGKVIALGSPADLISRLGGEHVVEFALGGEVQEPTFRPSATCRPCWRPDLMGMAMPSPSGTASGDPCPARPARRAWPSPGPTHHPPGEP